MTTTTKINIPFVWDYQATSHPDCDFNSSIVTTSNYLGNVLNKLIEDNVQHALINLEEEEHTFDEYTFFKAVYDYETKYNKPCKWVLTDVYYTFLYAKHDGVLSCLGSDSTETEFINVVKKLTFDTIVYDAEATSKLILELNPKIKVVATVCEGLLSSHNIVVPRYVLQDKYYKPLMMLGNLAKFTPSNSDEVKRNALKAYSNYYANFFKEYSKEIDQEPNINLMAPFTVKPGIVFDSDDDEPATEELEIESDSESESDYEEEKVVINESDFENSDDDESDDD